MQKSEISPETHTDAVCKKIKGKQIRYFLFAGVLEALSVFLLLQFTHRAVLVGYYIVVISFWSLLPYALSVLPYVQLSHLLKKHNRTLYDADLFEFLMEHSRW